MNKQTIVILGIIAAGSILGTVYATGTVITDTGITTGDLTITGTCTGCGGEASYGSWTTLEQEGTFTSNGIVNQMLLDNNGNLLVSLGINAGTPTSWIISNTGSITSYTSNSFGAVSSNFITQTSTGQYQAIWNDGAKVIDIYVNGTLAANVPLDFASKFATGNQEGIAFSPNGHWLAVVGVDFTDNTKHRFQIYRGI